mgnify:CR=1 FL=1
MQTGNKGEWSEIYVLYKLLVDKRIYGADQNLEPIKTILFPILQIIREETGVGATNYQIGENNEIIIKKPTGQSYVVNDTELKTKISTIFESIKNGTQTFTIPAAENFFEQLGIHSLNAGNSKKEDLVLKIHDFNIGSDNEAGFSIKSKLGSPATLLNASSATNFTYKITNLPQEFVETINTIETKAKIRDRLTAIKNAGGIIAYEKIDSPIFEENLQMIDTIMPQIIAEVLLAYYSDEGSTFKDLIEYFKSSEVKILNKTIPIERLTYKIKDLLNSSALGMVPATAWDGNIRAHGGVIIVREDGEIVCYHLYNAEAFRNYLFNNTRLESPSATRHGYGSIYQENDELHIKLNLQIRFIK